MKRKKRKEFVPPPDAVVWSGVEYLDPPPGFVSNARTLLVRDKRPDGEPYYRSVPINRDQPAPPEPEPAQPQ